MSKPAPFYEFINHPQHYNKHPSGVECIDIIEYMTYNLGAATKYLWRSGLKPGVSEIGDLKKAIFYIEREVQRVLRDNTIHNGDNTANNEDNISGYRRSTDST